VRRKRISLFLLAGALLWPGPARAQDSAGPTELEEYLGHPKRAPIVPAELRAMIRESRPDRLIVRGLDGADIVVDISEKEPERFAQFGGGRFLGFSFIGYEYAGYVLVDRAAAGEAALIDTGAAPVFSPDGDHFAAVQFSGAGWGNLEGFGLWRVGPAETRQRLLSSAFPPGEDWRIDGWPRSDCVAVSAVAERSGGDAQAPARRIHFSIETGEPLVIRQGEEACGGTASQERGDG